MVVGHSSGEIAAAYACGAISANEAISTAYYRGVVLKAAPEGRMMVVNLAATDPRLQKTLDCTGTHIACFNSPSNVTLSGPTQGIQSAASLLSDQGISCKITPITRPYHTAAMSDCASQYFKHLRDIVHPSSSRVPMYSSVTGREVDGSDLDASYWENNLRAPVLYTQAVETALASENGCDMFVEVGPHRLLSRPTQDTQTGSQRPYLSTMIRESNTAYHLMKLVGDLVVNGRDVNLHNVNGVPSSQMNSASLIPWIIDLPTYAWDYSSTCWIEPRTSSEWRTRRAPRHELLGSRIHGGDPSVASWRNVTSQSDLSWITDHQVCDDGSTQECLLTANRSMECQPCRLRAMWQWP